MSCYYGKDTKQRLLLSLWLVDGKVQKLCRARNPVELDAMLLSNYDSESIKQLQQTAREYGFRFENISHLKRRLRMFVKTD